jgi:alpha-L-rhamnosidase
MKNLIILCLNLFLLNTVYCQKNDLSVRALRTEYKTNPVGIDGSEPRLSWQIQTNRQNTLQTAYEIRAALSIAELGKNKNYQWQTGKIPSGQSIHVRYAGSKMHSSERVYWQVRIWDNHKRVSDWSAPAYWETGILDSTEWIARWITPDLEESTSTSQPCPYMRKEFSVKGPVSEARLYISSQGLYQAEINGKRVGNQEFTPGWTSYNKRIQYQTYDITNYLQSSDNAIGILLGDGWYRGYLGWGNNRNVYGRNLAVIAQIRIKYKDGTIAYITTEESWKSTTGPILKSDIYNGETYDARLEIAGWSLPGFDDKGWKGTKITETPKAILIAPQGPPVSKIQELTPVKISKTGNGSYLVDMGQNMVGWVKIKATGTAGDKIIMKHAEVLDKRGTIYYDNLRSAQQTNTYILRGKEEEIFEPHFTFQGFRYIEITGYPGTLTPDKITGIVIHSDMEPMGYFSCSDTLLNQLQHNIVWGQKGNFLDVPTDCPQRDERLGWTGDAQVFAPTACFNMNAASFYTKWMRDLAADQKDNGKVPHVIPSVFDDGGATGWADAAIIIPWTVYLNYADISILQVQYPSMKKWLGYMVDRAGNDYIWQEDWHFGDWLSFDDNTPSYMGAYTSTDLIATAYFAHAADLMAKIASILGEKEDNRHFQALHTKIKQAFLQEFVTPNGRVVANTQTAYTLALAFNLIDSSRVEKAAANLALDVKKFDHITTGFLGTPLICQTLTDHGYIDLAYRLLTRKDYPSWLYPVTKGATTIWERWDGMRPDSTFQDKGMNSFNHYAYGAIGKWMYEVIAGIGINTENPGYKNILINPRPGGGLTHAEAYHESMFGRISSGWRIANGEFILDISIPPNTTASVFIPGNAAETTINNTPLSLYKEATLPVADKSIITIGSGDYQIKYKLTE